MSGGDRNRGESQHEGVRPTSIEEKGGEQRRDLRDRVPIPAPEIDRRNATIQKEPAAGKKEDNETKLTQGHARSAPQLTEAKVLALKRRPDFVDANREAIGIYEIRK